MNCRCQRWYWCLFVLLATLCAEAVAQPVPLRWGLDETGGAPYVYDNLHQGFEVDLAEALARKLGRYSQPISKEWKQLPDLLSRGDLDIVLNGYEYAKQFHDQSTLPYYIYRLKLVVHVDNKLINDWDDLRKRKPDGTKYSVVVLTASAAQRYMQEKFGDAILLQSSDDVSSAFDLVARGQQNGFDATVQDNPASLYYVQVDEKHRLKEVGDGREENFYVMLTRVEDATLRNQINQALREMIQDGTLESIYRKYNLWNKDQERLSYWSHRPWPPKLSSENDDQALEQPAGFRRVEFTWPWALALLARAAGRTFVLAAASFPMAVVLGLLLALIRCYGHWSVRLLATFYVEMVRGTPLLLQLFFIFYMLPVIVPIRLEPMQAGIVGLALNYAAYEAENFRAGIQAVPIGQTDAALALGMTPTVSITRIVLPQAVRIVIPPMTNDFIALFKDTSVCSVILITELTRQYNVLYNNHREYIVSFAAITALFYVLMSYPLALLARFFERYFRLGGKRP